MINRKIATQASAGSIIEAKEYELEIVNRVQNNLIYFLSNYNRTFISGGAGTGKTWIAYKFAKQSSLEGKRVLIATNSKHLKNLFANLLNTYSNVDVYTLDELAKKDGVTDTTSSIELFEKYNSVHFELYDSVIVDEAQDFDQYQAMVISMHLKDEQSELRVFYDMTQNIYDKDFKDGFDIKLPPFILRENLRNTSSIYEWAKEETKLGKEVITNQIIGPSPISYVFKKEYDLLKYIESELVKLIDEEQVSTDSIVLLADHDNYQSYLNKQLGRWMCTNNGDKDCLRISLVEDFKGLEANVIFYIHNSDTPEKYNYVAYTRAKYYLYDLSIKQK